MIIGGFQKFSMIDYPEKLSAIVFTQGCNFKCPYCHNPELNDFSSKIIIEERCVLDFLKTRKKKLDAVVISGGEPTIQKDLVEFIEKVKNLGFLVKLDTNGSNPDVIETLLNKKLIDYIAMDIKSPQSKYKNFTKENINFINIQKSINIIINSDINYEFRTTIPKDILSINDVLEIGKMISGAKNYYLQKFLSTKVLDNSTIYASTYPEEELVFIINELKKNINNVYIR